MRWQVVDASTREPLPWVAPGSESWARSVVRVLGDRYVVEEKT
jgi:hypothetical protein